MNQKNKLVGLICIILSLCVVLIVWSVTETVKAAEIDEKKNQINLNNQKIEQIEEIKNQLHITAELIRSEQSVNNGFDLILGQKWTEYHNLQTSLNAENAQLYSDITELEKIENQKQLIGNFKITHYCPCSTCNGGYGNVTALGTQLTPYRTIAVDPSVIPLGSKVEIQGKIYIAEDTGGAIKGNKIDMCVSNHSEAYQKGVLNNVPVYLING